MKVYEILVSEIPIRKQEFNIGPYTLLSEENSSEPNTVLQLVYESEFKSLPIAVHISSLLTLALRRRIGPCSYLKTDAPLEYSKDMLVPKECERKFRKSRIWALGEEEEEKRLKIAHDAYNKIESLPTKSQSLAKKSIGLYQLSQWIKFEYLDLAYAILVGAIETLANDDCFLTFRNEWRHYGQNSEWDKFFVDLKVTDELADMIRQRILSSEKMIQRRFIRFIKHNLPESFWTEPNSDLAKLYGVSDRTILKDELEKILKNVYRIRSSLFHSGEPIVGDIGKPYEGMLIPVSRYVDAQRILNGESVESVELYPSPTPLLIPNYVLFERITPDCILRSLGLI
jgi:hypothetical protein